MKNDLFAAQTAWITTTVVAFVMCCNNAQHTRRKSALLHQQFKRTGNVRLNLLILVVGQRRRFAQYLGIDLDLTDILHQSGLAEILYRAAAKTEKTTKNHQMPRNVHGVIV